ncbi:MAG: hypothetical protein FWE32_06065 [Oscillospiraceae bacterium]|nr:hypothetical protein [Oscillospiraceae bacterium]
MYKHGEDKDDKCKDEDQSNGDEDYCGDQNGPEGTAPGNNDGNGSSGGGGNSQGGGNGQGNGQGGNNNQQ